MEPNLTKLQPPLWLFGTLSLISPDHFLRTSQANRTNVYFFSFRSRGIKLSPLDFQHFHLRQYVFRRCDFFEFFHFDFGCFQLKAFFPPALRTPFEYFSALLFS